MTISESEVRDEVLEWFGAQWDPSLPLVEWRRRLLESGWVVPSWSPEWFGRGLPAWTDRVAQAALIDAGGVSTPIGGGMGLAAPTIYEHGSDDLKQRLLGPTITGELVWCQLFSEPSAGSDLAGLRTTAERDGDDWVINGQKVWTTSADHADMAILVARTDWDVPKHNGITYFALDMHQPGVEVRPIRQMNDHSSFTEVFLSDVHVPDCDVVGDVGDGWRVARATLAHERSFSTIRGLRYRDGATGRVLDEARAEQATYLETYRWYPQRAGRADLVVERARSSGVADDPVGRQGIAELLAFQRASEWTAERARIARRLGRPPGAEGSIGKLALSHVARTSNHVHSQTSGAQAMLTDGAAPLDAVVAEVLVSTPAQSIAGGTDEIQRNIIGESVLGLPKEPAVDRGVPFRDVGSRSAGPPRA